MQIDAALDKAMTKAGLKNVEVAYRVGVSEKAVWRWRCGQKKPRASTLLKLFAVVPGFFDLVDSRIPSEQQKKRPA